MEAAAPTKTADTRAPRQLRALTAASRLQRMKQVSMPSVRAARE
jgi:hypothetical protein